MPRVLLIEDDPSIREGVGLGLRRRGHEVSAAETGEAGLGLMAGFRPELVLLDLMLPGINGVQVCRRIRETSQVPIIMLTARGDDFDIVVGLEAGADDYIVKPARTEVIEARIRAVLRRLSAPAGRPAKAAGLGTRLPELNAEQLSALDVSSRSGSDSGSGSGSDSDPVLEVRLPVKVGDLSSAARRQVVCTVLSTSASQYRAVLRGPDTALDPADCDTGP
ncbi:response regulator transcription factor [Streptomyces sp. ISL-86]|uniref:response regulator transcription factor n=1 Tax=Streptomyces sp. ISL-86 TaxID=2819187 RepID=UPI002552A6D4|nr:response regulator [Streptomyces sp. ISL-86]